MNGLEEEFAHRYSFQRLDANTQAGAAAMSAYGVRGHPSYVIVAADGQVRWQFSGQVTAEQLRTKLSEARP